MGSLSGRCALPSFLFQQRLTKRTGEGWGSFRLTPDLSVSVGPSVRGHGADRKPWLSRVSGRSIRAIFKSRPGHPSPPKKKYTNFRAMGTNNPHFKTGSMFFRVACGLLSSIPNPAILAHESQTAKLRHPHLGIQGEIT